MHIIDTYVKAMKIKVGNDEYNQITETYRTRLADKSILYLNGTML